MGRFSFNGLNNPGDGSKLPLDKKVKRWAFNLKAGLARNSEEELESARHISRGLK